MNIQHSKLDVPKDILKGNFNLLRWFKMRVEGKIVKKENLPEKECPVCNRPFSWRKKWADCWNEVIYCSKHCRGSKNG